MEQIILVVHLVIALAVIGLIMLQQGKGADIGASFGAGASQTIFGSSGSGNVLSRGTGWLAAAFFATSFGLAVIADQRTASEDDLGFVLPDELVVETRENSTTGDATGEIPVIESPAEAQAVSGDADLPLGTEPAPSDDLPAVNESNTDDSVSNP